MKTEQRRYTSLGRALTLVADLLDGKTHDRFSASKRVGVTPANAYRELVAISQRVPGTSWETRDGRRSLILDTTRMTPPSSYPTAIAACFGASVASLFSGTSHEAGIRSALQYVVGRTRRRKVFRDLERKFMFVRQGGEISLPEHAGELDDLVDAVLHSKIVKIGYRQFDGTIQSIRLSPLSIGIYSHQLYVLGFEEAERIRAYRFSRIESVDESGECFSYPSKASYDPDQLFADSFGIFISDDFPVSEVKIRVAARWTTYAQTHRWHRSQTISQTEAGVIVRLRVRTCPELEAWILGFGDEAVVLEPLSLRDRIASRLKRAATNYRRSDRRRG